LWDTHLHPIQNFEVGDRVSVSHRDWYGKVSTGVITRVQYLERIYSWLYTVEFDEPDPWIEPEWRYGEGDMQKI
jgi:hypothetical protein